MLNPNTFLRHGRYRIIRPIAQGGMGAVYEAEDLSLKTKVAVKEALVHQTSLRDAFEKEAQRLARLRHPALPNVIDHFTEQSGQYLVMEFIEGQDLAEMLRQRQQPFPVPEVIGWAERLLDALDYLHQKKVIHRDIKPANIKLTSEGELILLDFGLAKGGLTQHPPTDMSLKGYTPAYAPPEQVNEQGTDERSDLYSLAATLYALLTKQAPKESSVRKEVIAHHLPDPLRPANELNPQVSSQLAHTLARALALSPDKRFASAAEMRSQLVFPSTERLTPIPDFIPISPISPTTRLQSDTAQIRQKLDLAFDDSALSAFCLDYFPEVYDRFSDGMRKDNKITLLLDDCRRDPTGFEKLLDDVRNAYEMSKGRSEELKPLIDALEVYISSRQIAEATKYAVGDQKGTHDSGITRIVAKARQTLPVTTFPTQLPSWAIAAGGVIVLLIGILLGRMLISPNPVSTPPIVPITTISQKDEMTLLYVQEGEFKMGSANDDPDALDNEKPRHTVNLSAFWIDQTEVTNEMFARFVEETGHQTEAEKLGSATVYTGSGWESTDGADWQHPQGPESDLTDLSNHPVVQVSWNDANAYCQWAGRRLPTEAEWEKAARGTDSGKWPWGNKTLTGQLANICDANCATDWKDASIDDGYELTSPVGNYAAAASPYGALDMAGNAWEWVNDNWEESYYNDSPKENPPGAKFNGTKVLRGGSWRDPANFARVPVRFGRYAGSRSADWGFRCAK